MTRHFSISDLIRVSSSDPDDTRRRNLLGILLVGISLITFVGIVVFVLSSAVGTMSRDDATRLLSGFSIALLGFLLLLLINRYWSGTLAGGLFVVFLAVVIGMSDAPEEVVEGRTLFLFAIPIMVASVVLPSWASFGAAGLCSVVISIVGMNIRPGYVPPIPSMFGFFAIALVSWIAARSLEQALYEVREINRHLDRLVQERTRELAEALGENRAILNSIADGVVVFNNDDRVAVANPAVLKLFARSTETIIGRTVSGLLGEEVAEPDRAQMERMVRGEAGADISFKFEWGRKTFSVSCAPVLSEGGQRVGAVAVFRDFTREAELDRMKSAFISMVSHELRTPLNAVLGYAEMLKERLYGPVNEKQQETLRRIIANTNRQLGLVNDLLDRAQMEAGAIILNYEQLSPVNLMHDVQATMSVLAESKHLTLNCRAVPNVPSVVVGDVKRLQQIMMNLIGNAIKFTERGQVEVEVFGVDRENWGIRVADTGVGIPEEALEYIFEPFRRVDDSATRRQSGAGLGLSIVKQLVELMGGSVGVTSQLGVGSTFTVVLPIKPSPNGAKKEQA